MEQLIIELSKYGPLALLGAVFLFLMRAPLSDMLRGSNDTVRLIEAIERNSQAMSTFGEGLKHMADQFQHNNQMFTAITKEAGQMTSVLHDIKDEIIRSAPR